MTGKILIINTCKEKLHYFEFVKPIEDIIKNINEKYITLHYFELTKKDLEKTDKIIICGTSLKDMEYLKYIDKFNFLKSINKKVLGICSGMQIICLIFECKLVKGVEIGKTLVNFPENFLGLQEEKEVYSLHTLTIKEDKILRKNFNIFSKSKYIQAIKHKQKEIYGVLFHPEVRQKALILEFIKY